MCSLCGHGHVIGSLLSDTNFIVLSCRYSTSWRLKSCGMWHFVCVSRFLTLLSINLPSLFGQQSKKACERNRGLTRCIYGYEKRVACEVGEPNGEGIRGVWGGDVSLKRGIVWYCMVKELILKVKVWWSSKCQETLIQCVWYCIVKELILKVKVWWSSKCQETLIQWHSVSSQELWSFSKTSVWTSDRTSYRLLFFLWEWHSIGLWCQLQWNLYPLFPCVPFSHSYFSFILLCKISPL